jgi:hypothetical protein
VRVPTALKAAEIASVKDASLDQAAQIGLFGLAGALGAAGRDAGPMPGWRRPST